MPSEKQDRSEQVGEAFRPPATSLPTRKQNRLDLDVYREPGRFFVTITTHNRRAWFQRPDVVGHCTKALRSACQDAGFTLSAFCFMPDHLHVLVTSEGRTDLVRLVKEFKQATAWWFRNIHQAGGLKASPTSPDNRPSLWQKSYYDHILRREEDVNQVVRYILENPIRAGLATSVDEYPYAWSAAAAPELVRTQGVNLWP